MYGDEPEKTANSEFKTKRSKRITPKQRRTGEAVVLLVFLAFDFVDVWPRSHSLALALAVTGVGGVLLVEMPIGWWAFVTGILVASALAVWLDVGPAEIPDSEVSGALLAGVEPTPTSPCLKDSRIPAGATAILLGNNVAYRSIVGSVVLIQRGNNDILSVERVANGLFFNADIFGPNGALIARVEKNQIHGIKGDKSDVERGGDLSTLIVSDGRGQELLYVRYLNPSAIKIRGVFSYPGRTAVTITDNEIRYGA